MADGKKSDLDFTVSTNTDKAIADMAKMIAKQEASIARLKEANSEAKKTGKSFEEMAGGKIAGLPDEIARIATGFLSAQAVISGIQKTVQLLTGNYQEILRVSKAIFEMTSSQEERFLKTFTGWQTQGGAGVGMDQFQAQLQQKAKEMKIPYNAAMGIFNAYVGGRPDATPQQVIGAVERYGQALPWGEPEQMAKVAARLRNIMPGKSEDDLSDIVAYIRQVSGEGWEKMEGQKSFAGVEKLMEIGVDQPTALAMLTAGLRAKQAPGTLGGITSLLAPIKKAQKTPGKKLTTQQELQNLLAGQTEQERLDWIINNPELAKQYFGGTYDTLAPFLNQEKINQIKTEMENAQTNNLFQQIGTDVGGSAIGQKTGSRIGSQAIIENQMIGQGEKETIGYADKVITDYLDKNPNLSKIQKDIIKKRMEIKGLVGMDLTDARLTELSNLETEFGTEFRTRYVAGFGGVPIERKTKNELYDPEAAADVRSLIEEIKNYREGTQRQDDEYLREMKEHTAALKENTAALKAGNQTVKPMIGAPE